MAKIEKVIHKLAGARMSFLQLEKPRSFGVGDDGKAKEATYQGTALLDPTNEEHKKIIAALKADAIAIAKAKWGDGVEMKKLVLAFGDGNKKAVDSEGEVNPTYESYKNMFYVAATSKNKPLVANRAGELILPDNAQYPYSGSYGNMKITLFAWEYPKMNRRGMSCELRSVQYVKDGPAFGRGPIKAEDEFEGEGDEPAATTADDDFG